MVDIILQIFPWDIIHHCIYVVSYFQKIINLRQICMSKLF